MRKGIPNFEARASTVVVDRKKEVLRTATRKERVRKEAKRVKQKVNPQKIEFPQKLRKTHYKEKINQGKRYNDAYCEHHRW